MENQKTTKTPKLRWNVPMRQALCCLYRFFRCDKKQKEEIFFSMFRDGLRKRGITRFVPGKTLHAQWNWMRNTGDLVWCHVHRDTEFNMDGEWKNITQQIKSTALTLRLPLCEKTEDDIDTTRRGPRATMTLRPRAESPGQTPHSMLSPLHQRGEQERSHHFAESDHESSESNTMTVDDNQEQQTDQLEPRDNLEPTDQLEQTDPLRSDEPVVTSHGKICLWCKNELPIDERHGPNGETKHSGPEGNINPDQDQHPQDQHPQDQHPQDQHPQDQHQEHEDWDQHYHEQGQRHIHGQGYHLDLQLAMKGVPAEKMPPLLFRWSNRDSQGVNSKKIFRAGLFCNGEWFDPEDFSEDRFESFFRSHVTKQKVKTPFISTFQSPLAPLHRAIVGRNGAMLTIIDTSKLDTKVFYAYPLAIRTRTRVYNGWKGFGEYLVWGRIPIEAIAFTVEIESLEQIVQSHRDVNRLIQISLIGGVLRCNEKLREMLALKRKSPFQSGRTLGKLLTLLQVPAIHWENLACEFAKAWGWRHKKETVSFHSGVQSAPPYKPEELSDSENYEPPETDEDSGWTSDSEGASNSPSMSMCNQTETADDGNFSTHETLSSGIFPEDPELPLEQGHQEEVIDLTSDNEDTSSQRALQRDWPSDDDTYMYPDTPTKIRGKIPLQSEKKTTYQILLDGQTDMDVFEKVRNWS
ncbi:unnamed protein product [Penicillium glandicola]